MIYASLVPLSKPFSFNPYDQLIKPKTYKLISKYMMQMTGKFCTRRNTNRFLKKSTSLNQEVDTTPFLITHYPLTHHLADASVEESPPSLKKTCSNSLHLLRCETVCSEMHPALPRLQAKELVSYSPSLSWVQRKKQDSNH